MSVSYFFLNQAQRLRSGWRLLIYALLCWAGIMILVNLVFGVMGLFLGRGVNAFAASAWGWVLQALLLTSAGMIAGGFCARVIEGLPIRSLGWAFYKGWPGHFLGGSLVGGATLIAALSIAVAAGGLHINASGFGLRQIVVTLTRSLLVFILAAAAEETIFRGYALQTMARARLTWLGLALTSLPFAAIHLDNPNAGSVLAFVNTALAGVWLGVSYLKTRSLWFPLGLHWSWNWVMGAVAGMPVSGIKVLAPEPLLKTSDAGPAWLTGGAYGIEGGFACTLAVIMSALLIVFSTKLVANEELMDMTSHENPVRRREAATILGGAATRTDPPTSV